MSPVFAMGLIAAGLLVPFFTMKKGTMPESMRRIFKTGVAAEWKNFSTPGVAVGMGLVVLGLYGYVTAK